MRIVCSIALLAAALALGAPAAAQGATVLRTVKVDAYYTEPPGEIKLDCSFAGVTGCFAGYAYFTGTFVARRTTSSPARPTRRETSPTKALNA